MVTTTATSIINKVSYGIILFFIDKWLEFNDSNIKDYDARKIGVDCYGGKDSEESSEWSKGETSSTSAYILIYERNYKQPIKMQFKTLEDKNNVLQDVLNYDPEVEDTESELECNIPYNNFGRIVKEDFYKVKRFFYFLIGSLARQPPVYVGETCLHRGVL